MQPRRKRHLTIPKPSRNLHQSNANFKPKQTLPPLDLLADFQFTPSSSIKLNDIKLTIILNDLYPYFTIYSLTACYFVFITIQFIWQQFHSQQIVIRKYIDQDNCDIASFWIRLIEYFVYANFLLMFGSYLQHVYKFWYFIALIVVNIVSVVVFQLKNWSGFNSQGHIYTAVYSLYCLILVEKRMKNINLEQTWIKIKKLPIWQRILSLRKKQQQAQTDIIDFEFTQRPLSIKGGQTDDSFSYDSIFSYSDPFDLTQQRNSSYKGYFESNISKRSSYISNNLQPKMKPAQSYFPKFTSQKSILQQSEIQSTIASSQTLRKEKHQEEIQLIKIYKCLIMTFLVYSSVTKVQWAAYLVGGCTLLGVVEVLTNERLKFVKFACFVFVAIVILAWM